MSASAEAFDGWIRGPFVALNSALERLYLEQDNPALVEGVGDPLKAQLRDEGHAHVVALWREGNTGDGFDSAFSVLGNVGLYLAALRRHELTNPAREDRSPFTEASSLALHIGANIGMAPRFSTAHLTTHNRAVNGVRKSFTDLDDEFLFIDENCRGILSLQRAADALMRIVSLGVSNPVADVQFAAAAAALDDAMAANERLFTRLDMRMFFYAVRPYYKPYRVGRQEYRGANAGDFAGINQLDLLLGLAQANDAYYAQLLVDKLPYMLPEEQEALRDCMHYPSLLDRFLAQTDRASESWFQANLRGFLTCCDRFAGYARQHHDQLVARFIVEPAERFPDLGQTGLTASGPPLAVLVRALETLRDLRCAADRDDIASRHADVARLRALLRD